MSGRSGSRADHSRGCECLGKGVEAPPGIFRVLVGQRLGVKRHVEFRRDAQDLAALNTGELDLPGLRVTDGEPEMRRDLVPALSKPEACPLFRTRSGTLARGTALGRPRDMGSAATLNRTYCGAGAGAGAGAGSGAGAGASVAAGVASTGFPCMMQSYVARSNANLQPCRMPWTTPNAIAAINSMRIRRMCSSLP